MKNCSGHFESFENKSNYFSIQTGEILTISSLLTLAPLTSHKDIHTSFFLKVFNCMRQSQSSKKLGCDFVDFAKVDSTSFRNKAQNIQWPAFVHAHARNAELVQHLKAEGLCQHEIVSALCSDVLESKCNTALAFEKMNDTKQCEVLIDRFITQKHLSEVTGKLMKSLAAAFFPVSGVVKAKDMQDAEIRLVELLQKHQATGIVFQLNKSVGGKGTAIFKSQEIARLLQSNASIITVLSQKNGYEDNKKIEEELQSCGLSFQECVDIQHELCFTLRKKSSTDSFELDSVSQQHIGEVGHIGNTIMHSASFEEQQPDLKNYLLLIELVVDVMLKDAGVDEGLQAVFKTHPSLYLEVMGPDFFQTDQGLVLSEINARFPAFSRSLASAVTMRDVPLTLPLIALKTEDIQLSKSVVQTLENYSPSDVSALFSSYLNKVSGAHKPVYFEGFKINNNYQAHNNKDYVRVTLNFIFPDAEDVTAFKEKQLIQVVTASLRQLTSAGIQQFMKQKNALPLSLSQQRTVYTVNGIDLSGPEYVPGPVHANLQTKFLKNIGTMPSVIPHSGYPVTSEFISIFNRLRVLQGNRPLQAFPTDLKSDQNPLKLLMPVPVPFYVSQRELPNVKNLQNMGILERVIVSPQIHGIVESKCATADAFHQLLAIDSKQHVRSFLEFRNCYSEKTLNELMTAIQASVPRSGVFRITSQNPAISETEQNLRNLLSSFRETGIVFQKNSCSSGKGTVLLNAKAIDNILLSEKSIIDTLEDKMKFKKYFSGTFLNEIAKNGLSYQELIRFEHEIGLNFIYNRNEKSFDIKAINIQQIGEIGNIGGTLFPLEDTFKMTGVDLDQPLFALMTECILDLILKNNGYTHGIADLNQSSVPAGSQELTSLETFGVDLFSSGSRFIFSEFNARPTSTSRALYSLAHLKQQPMSLPLHRIETDEITFSKATIDTLLRFGEESAYSFIDNRLQPYLQQAPKAQFDAIRISENYPAASSEDFIRLCIGFFFPEPDNIKDAGFEKHLCKKITHDLRAVTPADIQQFFEGKGLSLPVPRLVTEILPMSFQSASRHLPKIAVIGAGLGGISTVSGLLAAFELYTASAAMPEIHLYDSKKNFISGYPYDINQTALHLLNQPADNMGSLNHLKFNKDDDHFYHWALNDKDRISAWYSGVEFRQNAYWPRSLYGRYLLEHYAEINNRAKSQSVNLQERKKLVSSISPSSQDYPLNIMTVAGETEGYDKAVLALGGWNNTDMPFKGAENHYFSAYDSRYLDSTHIAENSVLAVKGTGLSAFDVVVDALESGLYRKVLLHSRSGLLRQVRPDVLKSYARKHFTLKNVQALKKMKALNVESLMKLLQQELHLAYRAKDVPNFMPETIDGVLDRFDQNIADHKAQSSSPWWDVFKSLPSQERHDIFNQLTPDDRKAFRSRLGTLYLSIIAPVSITNAEKLQTFIREGRVQMVNGVTQVNFVEEQKYFIINNNNLAEPYRADIYVNATGAQRSARHQPLLKKQLEKGYFYEAEEGGIALDYKSKAINTSAFPPESLYGLGHIGNGQSILNFSSNSAAKQGFALGFRLGKDLMQQSGMILGTRPRG